MPGPRTIGDLLRMYRAENRWTQEMLADKLNMSQSKLSRLESNSRDPDLDDLVMIGEVLNIPFLDVKSIYDQDPKREMRKLTAQRSATMARRVNKPKGDHTGS